MYPPDLAQEDIEALDPESYSNFLAFGDPLMPELPEEDYEAWLQHSRVFDL
jgi:hypothetical protein